MIAGHFAAGLALKPKDNSMPLWALLIAGQLLDIAAMVFILLGFETMEPQAGITAINSNAMYMPFSHSLILLPVWMAIGAFLYKLSFKSAAKLHLWIIAIIIGSHWILDYITHIPDLPIFVSPKPVVGLGLWQNAAATMALETILVLMAAVLFWRAGSVKTNLNRATFILLICALLFFALASEFLPLPENGVGIARTALLMMAGVTGLAVLSEYPRTVSGSKA